MKSLFLIVSLPFFCIYQDNKTDWEKDELKGKVKQIKQDCYEATEVDGKVVQGKRTSETGYLHFKKVYSDKGKIIKDSSNTYLNSNVTIYICKYDASGKIIKRIGKDAFGNIFRKEFYLYDDKGNITEEDYYKTDSTFISDKIYSYDERGRLVEIKELNDVGRERGLTRYNYYNDGSKKETITHGTARYYSSKTYNEKGYVIESSYNGDITRGQSFNTYDEKGKLIITIGYPLCSDTTKKTGGKIFYTYNNYGDLIEKKGYDKVGNLTMRLGYEYEYDKIGNWVNKTEHNYMPFPVKKDQHPGHFNWSYAITIRQIEYY